MLEKIGGGSLLSEPIYFLQTMKAKIENGIIIVNGKKKIATRKIVLDIQEVFECYSSNRRMLDGEWLNGNATFHPICDEYELQDEGTKITEFEQENKTTLLVKKRTVKLKRLKLFLFLNRIFKFF